jgi:phenylalanyl-tRNA synthetase beta chain
MKILLSWLRELVPGLPDDAVAVADALVRAGFEVEAAASLGRDLTGVVVGRIEAIDLVEAKKKNVRLARVDVGGGPPRQIVCGAFNFDVGDAVAVALPGAVLPGGFEIGARKTYGHLSEGMICSARELGAGDDHAGILVLGRDAPVGADAAELLCLADDLFELKVTPDRGYALSARGLARELATAFGLVFADPGAPADPGTVGDAEPGSQKPGHPVVVEDGAGCDRYVASLVTGVDPAAVTPFAWRRRLELCGMRPISVPVDVTNAVMLGLGQPLHAFDAAALSGPIVVRRARPGERLTTLDGVDRALHPEDLVIADDSGAVALAGVMGGAATEISAATTEILIEAAHFDPLVIARTARRHQLPSEASRRFERGVDPALAPVAAEAAARMLADLAGARPVAGATDVDVRSRPATISFPLAEPERLGGRPYPPQAVLRRLTDVGCRIDGAPPEATRPGDVPPGGVVTVTPPSWRPDLSRPADLVEEVLRLEGYDTIPVTLPRLPAGRGLAADQRLRRGVGRALAYEGFSEVLTVPFVADDVADRLGLDAADPRRAAVRIANPIAADAACLRTSLLPGLFSAALRNIGRGQADLALFEIGTVFCEPAHALEPVPVPPVTRRPGEAEIEALNRLLPDQPRHVAALLTGLREPAGWWGGGRAADWGDAVAAAHAVARAAGVELAVAAAGTAPYHPGRCAALSVTGAERVIGHAGELHPRVVAAFDLPPRSVALELDLDALVAAAVARPPVVAPAPSPYPPADRDVALVVGIDVPIARVSEALRSGAGNLLESLTLFDVFEGAQVGPDRRSLAFGMRLRAADRTLTAAEANHARDAAVAEAVRVTGAALRT